MNVVCNPADASGRDTVLFGNSAQEWPEPFPQVRLNIWARSLVLKIQ
jgi:hypothetical protein